MSANNRAAAQRFARFMSLIKREPDRVARALCEAEEILYPLSDPDQQWEVDTIEWGGRRARPTQRRRDGRRVVSAADVRAAWRAFLDVPEWEPCDPGCPGMFRNAETGRWDSCDDCACHCPAPNGGMLPRLFDDADVRAFVRFISRETNGPIWLLRARMAATQNTLGRLNGWGYSPDPRARL